MSFDASSGGKTAHPEDCIATAFLSFTMVVRSSPRSVSIARLHVLPHFHLQPINACSARDLTGF